MKVDLVKSFRFEAAHATPYRGDSARLHGHSYEVDLVVSGQCDEELAWLMDYADINERFEPLYRALDHRYLNEVDGLADVTTNGIATWIKERLEATLPELKDVHLRISGPCTSHAEQRPPEPQLALPEHLRLGFEAAHALPKLPPDHKCFQMHGHSFTVDVAAKDLNALTAPLRRVYDALDHRCLNEIEGLSNPTSEALSQWIWRRIQTEGVKVEGVQPLAVAVAETCTARCIYRGP